MSEPAHRTGGRRVVVVAVAAFVATEIIGVCSSVAHCAFQRAADLFGQGARPEVVDRHPTIARRKYLAKLCRRIDEISHVARLRGNQDQVTSQLAQRI